MPEMVAPRARVFRPLVKGNEALGTRLRRNTITYGDLNQQQIDQPRSQGLSSLPPLVVGRKTLVAAGHVPSYDTNFPIGVGSTNNFCRSQLKRKKGPAKFSSPVVSFIQVR